MNPILRAAYLLNTLTTLFFLLINFSCSQHAEENSSLDLETINVKEAFDKKEKLLLSEVASNIEYIPLETNEKCFIDNYARIAIDKDFIVVVSFRQIFLFDRISGDFVREVGAYGKGPGEYTATTHQPFDAERRIIYAVRGKDILEYNLDGSLNRTITSPFDFLGLTFTMINTGIYASYMPNVLGDSPEFLFLFDAEGNEVKVVPNVNFYEREGKLFNFYGKEAEFYKHDNRNYFKEIWNDTLFILSPDTLVPHYVFNAGDMSINFELRGKQDARDLMTDLLRIQNIFESTDNIFFSFSHNQQIYAAYHNKSNSETKISNYTEFGDNGFVDDILDIGHLVPQGISNQNELYGLIIPDSLTLTYLKKGERYANGRSISLDSNPVVGIAKLH